MYHRVTAAALLVALFAGADWTRFRGSDATGISSDKGLPTTWSATENVVWKTAMPGFGSSSPITLGDKIFLTCYTGYAQNPEQPGEQKKLVLHTLCVDRSTGKILWNKTREPELPETEYGAGRIVLHGYASATPVTDGKAVYVFFGKSGVVKYDLDGKELWSASVGTATERHRWGSGASLILYKDFVVVNASAESQSIRALNKADGKQVWQFDGIADSWCTPLVVSAAGKDELVVAERTHVYGLDPSNGKKLWFYAKPSDYVCPSTIAHKGIVYIINSRFQAMLMAIQTGGRGDIGESHVKWTKERWTTRVSTPVYHEGHLYAIDQTGYARCVNAETGEEVYREKLEIGGSGDKIYASVVAGDGKFYGVSRLDGTVVLALSPIFKKLAHNRLGDESTFNATPAIVDGQLLLRSDKFLYCIGK